MRDDGWWKHVNATSAAARGPVPATFPQPVHWLLKKMCSVKLLEAKLLVLLTEALAANVELVLADDTGVLVRAHDAAAGALALDDLLVRLPQLGVAHGSVS